MPEIIRRPYLERLESGRDRTDVVKIITGMRRSGKTVLMRQFIRRLIGSGVPEDNIVYMNFESRAWEHIVTHSDLLDHISSLETIGRIYVFLDEIQRVRSWEKAVNSLQVDSDADIYITGSNAYLLSSELSTYLSGRFMELRILPLSFSEFLELHPGEKDRRFMQYLRTGSLPIVDPDGDETFEQDLLTGVFNTVLVKDVLAHTGASDASVLEDVARFLYSNVGNITSCNSISRILKEDNRQVRRYIDAMRDAFLIHKAERFDIRGKKLLDTLEKYYVSDIGMRNAVLGISSREDVSRLVENVVYLELIRRGYEVAVGKYGDTEVDFTARRGDDVEYYQVTLSMISESAYEREVRPFRLIRDSYPKTVLSMDSFLMGIPDGIRHRNVIDWLLEERSLQQPIHRVDQLHAVGHRMLVAVHGDQHPPGIGIQLQERVQLPFERPLVVKPQGHLIELGDAVVVPCSEIDLPVPVGADRHPVPSPDQLQIHDAFQKGRFIDLVSVEDGVHQPRVHRIELGIDLHVLQTDHIEPVGPVEDEALHQLPQVPLRSALIPHGCCDGYPVGRSDVSRVREHEGGYVLQYDLIQFDPRTDVVVQNGIVHPPQYGAVLGAIVIQIDYRHPSPAHILIEPLGVAVLRIDRISRHELPERERHDVYRRVATGDMCGEVVGEHVGVGSGKVHVGAELVLHRGYDPLPSSDEVDLVDHDVASVSTNGVPYRLVQHPLGIYGVSAPLQIDIDYLRLRNAIIDEMLPELPQELGLSASADSRHDLQEIRIGSVRIQLPDVGCSRNDDLRHERIT